MSVKRDSLICTAHELFYKEGFIDVGIDRVVKKANVALGTLYRYFDGRESLVVATMKQREDLFFSAMQDYDDESTNSARVLILFDNLENWIANKGGNGCFFSRAASAHPDSQAIFTESVNYKQRYLALTEQTLIDSGWSFNQAQGLAPAIYLLLEGASFTSSTLGLRRSIAHAKNLAHELLLREPPQSKNDKPL